MPTSTPLDSSGCLGRVILWDMPISASRIRQLNSAPDSAQSRVRSVLVSNESPRRFQSLSALCRRNRKSSQAAGTCLRSVDVQLSNTRMTASTRSFSKRFPKPRSACEKAGIGYVFYLRRHKSDPNNTFYTLARTPPPSLPTIIRPFVARTHNASVPAKVDAPYYVVDSSCIVPMSEIPHRQYGAYTIRPRIHRLLPQYLVPADHIRVKHRFTSALAEIPHRGHAREYQRTRRLLSHRSLRSSVHSVSRRPPGCREAPQNLPRKQALPLRRRPQRTVSRCDFSHESLSPLSDRSPRSKSLSRSPNMRGRMG